MNVMMIIIGVLGYIAIDVGQKEEEAKWKEI